ncbi:Neuronal acetylcholine receptor subunit alpha 4 [Fasciola hepatica]|uniref:Neuronal acetylcholine receptor subunit alpha 4 n=1 Tax=Fasciola hepatica TaxID=6192 RepID=A0A4E0R7W7_FASHE|nr:Neuronal acetylcholine receptor subunit alpha 4 [Fasciola hepatica]
MLEFGSLTYDKTQLELDWWTPDDSETPMPYVDYSDYVPANEWFADGEAERHLRHEKRTKQIRSVKRYRVRGHLVDGVTEERHYPVLRFLMVLYRNPSFHMFILVVPCLLLSLLTLVVFWLPPDSSAKMMLGINIFVAFFVLLLLLAESMPTAVKNFPLIGVFFCLNMVMITLSTYLATVSVNLFYRGQAGRPLPIWVRRFFIDGCGRMVWLRQYIPLADIKRTGSVEAGKTSGEISIRTSTVTGSSAVLRVKEERSNLGMQVRKRKNSSVSQKYPQMRVKQIVSLNAETASLSVEDQRDSVENLIHVMRPIHGDARQVSEDISCFHLRQKTTSEREAIAMEWRTLALVVDRLFFILYLIIMGVSLGTVVLKTEVIDMTLLLINRNAISLTED